MRSKGLFSKILRPLSKRWQVIFVCLLASVLITARYLYEVTPMYKAVASVKIQSGKTTTSEKSNSFAANIPTEVEVLKSRLLFEKALATLDFNVEYFHTDESQIKEEYHRSPFTVTYQIKNNSFYKQSFAFRYIGGDRFTLSSTDGRSSKEIQGRFGVPVSTNGLWLTLTKTASTNHSTEKTLSEPWQFSINSTAALSNELLNDHLIVAGAGGNTNIIKITYSHPVAEKAAKLVNAIAGTYIEQEKEERQSIAGNTITFLNKQLALTGADLASASTEIRNYRQKNEIVNIPLQTATTYKTVGDLEDQKANTMIQLATLEQMSDYLRKNRKINLTAPDFGSVTDASFSDAVTRLNSKSLELEELKKNTASADGTAKAEAEILFLKNFLIESTNNTRRKLLVKQDELTAAISKEKDSFKNLPEKEGAMQELTRNYYLSEKTFNYLVDKRNDAILSSQLTLPQHRIIEAGVVPLEPETPQAPLVWMFALLIGFATGVVLAYVVHFAKAEVEAPEDLAPSSTIPVIGQIALLKKTESAYQTFTALTTRMLMNQVSDKNMVITVTSTRRGEGKSYIAAHLARTLAAMDKKVLLIDANTYKPQQALWFNVRGTEGLSDFYTKSISIQDLIQITSIPSLDLISAGNECHPIGHLIATPRTREMIDELKLQYDFVIVDTPESGEHTDAIPFMKWSDLNLYVVKAESGKTDLIANAELIKEEYRLEEVHYVINGMKEQLNHTGYVPSNNISTAPLKRMMPQLTNLFFW